MSSSNFFQLSRQAYASGVGTTSTNRNLVFQRDPTTSDVNYELGTFWQNTSNVSLWYLNSLSTSSGVLSATWIQIESSINGFVMQTGTTPVTPNATGDITFNGAVVAAGTNPVRTDGTAASTMALEVQISQAIAATDATKIGLSNFNSSHFSVDANGFVSLVGGGAAVDSFQPDTGTNPVVPDAAGLVAIRGQSTPNVSGIQVTGGTNELDIAMFSPFASAFSFLSTLTIGGSTLGTNDTLTVQSSGAHTQIQALNTGAGDAFIYTAVATGTTDPFFGTSINGVVTCVWGLDQSDSSKFKISYSDVLGTNDAITITSARAITFDNAYTFPTADGSAGQSLVTNGAGQLSFSSTGSIPSYTNVTTSPYVVLSTDYFLSVDTSALAITIQLPNAPTTNRTFVIKDRTGNAVANNISVTTVGGIVLIDAAATYTINAAYNSIQVVFDGTKYEVF